MSFVINAAHYFKEFGMPLQLFKVLNPKYTFSIKKCTKLVKSKIYDSKGTLPNTGELLKVIKNKENHKLSFKFFL